MKTVPERLRSAANMCARVNAAVTLLCEDALAGANELDRVTKQRDELLAALKDARRISFYASCQAGVVARCECANCVENRIAAVIAKVEG